MPAGEIAAPLPVVPASGFALGIVEGWRGPVVIALESGADGMIRRCHPHDPSWQNWPVLERAVLGNIVPDFPLINKSFNLSYSGRSLADRADAMLHVLRQIARTASRPSRRRARREMGARVARLQERICARWAAR